MVHRVFSWYRKSNGWKLSGRYSAGLLIAMLAARTLTLAQDAGQKESGSSAHVTHLLGFVGAKNNANGILSIEGDALQFQKTGKPAAQVKITSIQDVLLGEQSKQVGGTTMTLGKAAVPFGGGRAISLFAHKKYDTLTLEYVDADGGFHGAVFQLNKGQAKSLRNELIAKGARVSDEGAELIKQSAEAPSETK